MIRPSARYFSMSTLWMMCICIVASLLVSTESADISSILPLTSETSTEKKSIALDFNVMVNSEKFTEWTKTILSGISILPNGVNPGRLVVFGENAEPILTGKTEEDVFIAAAQLGKGRIVAIAQDFYNNRTENAISILDLNIKKWLTRNTFDKDSIIINTNEKVNGAKLKSSKLVIFQGSGNNIPLNDLTDYVRNGGALLHCFTPWRWLKENAGKTLSDAPYMALLTEAGLIYLDGYINSSPSGFIVEENKAKDAHMLRFLAEAKKDVGLAAGKTETLKILRNLTQSGFLPLRTIVINLLNNCTVEIESIAIPSYRNQVKDKIAQQLLQLWLFYFNLLEPVNIKAPGVNLFPYDFTDKPPLKSRTLEFHSDRYDHHSTGCYLPAGQILGIEVIDSKPNLDGNWQLLVGCHTDELSVKESWKRWPVIARKIRLTKARLELSTPFGGVVYFISPNEPKSHLKVKLDNVVDSPYFRLTEDKNGKEQWKSSRQTPGLWADIVGELITITLPATNVRNLDFENVTTVMKTWDRTVRLMHDLRGTNVSEFRRQWIVTDVQKDAGHMHSGYPIVTALDVGNATSQTFFLNNTLMLKDGSWGAFHEIGHNMQRRVWTFNGTDEVTCNIFTLYTQLAEK